MNTNRRKFLRLGAVATFGAGLAFNPLRSAFAQGGHQTKKHDALSEVPHQAKTERAFYFKQSTFEPHVKTDFVVRAGRTATTLHLLEVAGCPARVGRGAPGASVPAEGECFSLLFRASAPLSTLRTVHAFDHGALGNFSLFVTQTVKKSDPDGIYYEAVINQATY